MSADLPEMLLGLARQVATSPASPLSVWSLLAALTLAMVWVSRRRRRIVSIPVLSRTLFPKHSLTSRSARADWIMVLAGHLVNPVLLGGAVIAAMAVATAVQSALEAVFPVRPELDLPLAAARALTTLLGFLAFEFASYLCHRAMHEVPILWHFHKVHHNAETLSPLTGFRIHPLEVLISQNVSALGAGTVIGACLWLFGEPASPFTLDGTNVLLIVGVSLVITLQHTHAWLPLRGWLGCVINSPAHHQLHHSIDPRHFNANYGYCLAIWDTLFGSLKIPGTKKPQLTFGVTDLQYNPHGLAGLYVLPLVDAVRSARLRSRQPIAAAGAT